MKLRHGGLLRGLVARILAPATRVSPDTDLSRFEGRRVEVTQVESGTRYAWRGVLTGLRHGPDGATCLMTAEQWTSGVHGGEWPMALQYRNATVRLI